MIEDTHEPAGAGQAIETTWNRLQEQAPGLSDRSGGMIDDPVRRGSIEDDIPQPAVADEEPSQDGMESLPGNDVGEDYPDDSEDEIQSDLPPMDPNMPSMLR